MARGTLSDLAAVSLHPPTASAGRGSPSTAPSGVTIPARADLVAAQPPGGGGLSLLVEAPANPIIFDLREVDRVAAAYPDDARYVPAWERERHFTPLQQAAGLLRSQPECCPEAVAMGFGR